MQNRTEQNKLLRQYHYKWKQIKGDWILLGPDGWRATVEEAEQTKASYQQSPPPAPQEWARSIIEQQPLILDTETTGLDLANNDIIELALVELDGTVVIDTLIQTPKPIPEDASKIHGITNDMLTNQPTFPEMWDLFLPYLSSRPIVIYNASYDIPMLAYNAQRHKIRMPRPNSHCLMAHYTDYAMGIGNNYQNLQMACQQFGIDPPIHRALSDAQASRQVLLHMANLK